MLPKQTNKKLHMLQNFLISNCYTTIIIQIDKATTKPMFHMLHFSSYCILIKTTKPPSIHNIAEEATSTPY